jgi:hypothetical protein
MISRRPEVRAGGGNAADADQYPAGAGESALSAGHGEDAHWDYDSLDAITRGEVDLGFTGRETHPRSRELLKLMPWFIDYEILFSDRPWSICAKIIRRFRKSGIWRPSCAIRISASSGNAAIPGRWMKC